MARANGKKIIKNGLNNGGNIGSNGRCFAVSLGHIRLY